jgi:hypothetical protein
MLRGCVGKASTSATVTRSLQLRRGYADDGADLRGLAKRIESGYSNPAGNAAARTLQPPGFARSQLAKLSARGAFSCLKVFYKTGALIVT